MKRNNILAYLLFALTAVLPVLYVCYKVFLPGYTVLFEGFLICADVLNVIMLGVCIAMLLFKDKSIGKAAMILLESAVVILPVSRNIMTALMYNTFTVTDDFAVILYLALVVVMVITGFIYTKAIWMRAVMITLFTVTISCNLLYGSLSAMFGYQKTRDVADLPSPDGIHSARVIEYGDDDNRSWLYKAVFTYNSAQSFSIGPAELMKDWNFIDDYPEENNLHLKEEESPLDEDTQITWPADGEIRIQDRTYTYDGEKVTQPPEPPM